MNSRFITRLVLVSVALMILAGCAALQEVQQTLATMQRLQFKLDGVMPGTLAGVELARVNDPSRLSFNDGLMLTAAFAKKSLPLTFTLNVAAKNPNDGSGTTSSRTASITAFPWKLKIDGKETISGDVPGEIQVPGTGEVAIIGLPISLDLYQFFGERGYKDVLNLALAIAGQQGTASRLTLTASPKVQVQGIQLSYPGELDIVDKEFTNP